MAISSTRSKGGPSSEPANQLIASRGETHVTHSFLSKGMAASLPPEDFRTHAYASSTSATSLQDDFDIFSSSSTIDPIKPLHSHEAFAKTQIRHGKQRRNWVGDGAEVADLLSDARAFFDEPGNASMDAESFDDYAESFKPNDMDGLSFCRLRDGLPALPVYHSPSPASSLNLLSNSDSGYNCGDQDFMIIGSTNPVTTETGIPFQFSAVMSSTDFGSWLDVLTRYQDDVWGYMLPSVKKARAEINRTRAESGTAPENQLALRRLGMLLGHFSFGANRVHGFLTSIRR